MWRLRRSVCVRMGAAKWPEVWSDISSPAPQKPSESVFILDCFLDSTISPLFPLRAAALALYFSPALWEEESTAPPLTTDLEPAGQEDRFWAPFQLSCFIPTLPIAWYWRDSKLLSTSLMLPSVVSRTTFDSVAINFALVMKNVSGIL